MFFDSKKESAHVRGTGPVGFSSVWFSSELLVSGQMFIRVSFRRNDLLLTRRGPSGPPMDGLQDGEMSGVKERSDHKSVEVK